MNFEKYVNKVQYSKNASQAWREEARRIDRQFKIDLFSEFDVIGHPKAAQVFNLAWEHGHASGLKEVYNYFSEFVELIK